MSEDDFQLDEDFALRLDAEDPLGTFRDRFYQIPGAIARDIYLEMSRII